MLLVGLQGGAMMTLRPRGGGGEAWKRPRDWGSQDAGDDEDRDLMRAIQASLGNQPGQSGMSLKPKLPYFYTRGLWQCCFLMLSRPLASTALENETKSPLETSNVFEY